MNKQHMKAWQGWARNASSELNAEVQGKARAAVATKAKRKRTLREPSGLCRWRHHDLCTLNSVQMLNAELVQHVVDLDFAIGREAGALRAAHVYHLDQVIKELWFLRGRMASCADRNGSPVDNHLSQMWPSMMARLDAARLARKELAHE